MPERTVFGHRVATCCNLLALYPIERSWCYMPYFLLGRKNRESIREISVRWLRVTNYDKDEAFKRASEEIRTRSIVITALIWLAVKLAYALIIYFWNRRETLPSPFYQPGEPGY